MFLRISHNDFFLFSEVTNISVLDNRSFLVSKYFALPMNYSDCLLCISEGSVRATRLGRHKKHMSSSQDEREPTAIRKLVGLFHTAREYLNPVLKNSKFKETGVLTPDEFVAAGDFLVYKFPTWQWAGGLKGKQKDYLPKDKQYLITKNVPCLKRVKAMEYHQDVNAADALDDEEGWVATHLDRPARQDTEIEDMEASLEAVQKGIRALMTADLPQDDSPQEIPNLDDIPDIEDEMAEEEDPAALRVSSAVLEPTGASTSRADDDDTRILRTR